MKEDIIRLRKEGKSYGEIQKELGCSKGTIAYHCGEGQKEKYIERQRRFRKNNVIARRVNSFKQNRPLKKNRQPKYERSINQKTQDKSYDFQRKQECSKFNFKDVLEHYGEQTTCYLSGRPINLSEPRTYHFDHIIPVSKGGDCSFENLGIARKESNKAKSDLLVEEFIELCKDVLEHNGYIVTKNVLM
jgi:CRISPR/Cas system Type II protein with McrA/HNH and RuvC-like nuclease domain